MIGITSYGGYIPRLRLDRMSIYRSMGWFAPATALVAQGERSFCNWDEDSLTMAVAAARDCLKGADRAAIDGCYMASTTLPFADRLNAGVLKTALDLRDDLVAEDFAASQRAGTSALITALEAVRGGGRQRVLVTAADRREAKAAYFYEMWYGDGAASLLVGQGDEDELVAELLGTHSVTHDFVGHYRGAGHKYAYMWEERWLRDEGYARIIPEAVGGLLEKLSLTIADVDRVVYPCFFAAEHKRIARQLGAPPEKVEPNLHEQIGETGAAHPFVMLVRALERAEPGQRILVCGFGQGCDALMFRVTEGLRRLAPREGVAGWLTKKCSTQNYLKYLVFRGLVQTEMGIRAEAPTQTAMSVLWRKRRMLLGLVGGRCRECGTPQFPRSEVCVNPECRAQDSQEDYPFADRCAVVKSVTGDLLAVSVDPPAVYGMVQFEGGGRMMADFTDCVYEEVRVGQKARMSFRKRYDDKERGFTGYFWKAVPEPEAAPAEEDRGLRFDGQVAVVTGGGAGLGRTYALELAKRGAKVVVNDLGGARDGSGAGGSAAADAVVEEIRGAGGEAVASYDSVATVEGGEAIILRAIEAFGRIDILVSNAGILRDKSFAKMTSDEWGPVLSVHLDGAFNVVRPAFVRMKEQGYGRIVLTTSAAGLFGNFGQTNYSSAKMGLVGIMNTLKLEGEKYDVKVNTVAPVAGTRLTEDILPPDMLEKLRPECVTPLVVYLCSKACGQTGAVVSAGMGHFSRAAIVSAPGLTLGDGRKPPTVEEVHKRFGEIHSLEGATEFSDATAALGPMLAAGSGGAGAGAGGGGGGGGGGSEVVQVFEGMPKAFRRDKAEGVEVVFQYKLSGTDRGEWVVEVAGGECTVREGVHDKPTTTIIMSAEDFVGLIRGTVNAMQAFTTGRLKIEGDVMKSQLLQKLFKF